MADAKVVLITGANSGIGYQVVKALYSAEKPYTVLVGARSEAKAQETITKIQAEFPSSSNKLSPLVVDVESDELIEKAYDTMKGQFGRLDALINNAGASFDQAVMRGELSARDAWNKSWNVNVSGAQALTSTFVPLLLASSDPRIIFVTSGGSTLAGTEKRTIAIDQPPQAGWPKTAFGVAAYRSAKTGLNMMMREWERILKNDGVKVWAISPGLLATNLGGDPELLKKIGAADPAVAGPLFRGVLEGHRDGEVGKVVNKDGVQPW
ncbi:hypothetical protein BDW62DRAFT_213516 [Aspergillus aurantiobrunneus]